MKSLTEKQLAMLEIITRDPGDTCGLFRLISQIIFLEIINYSDTKKCHIIYFSFEFSVLSAAMAVCTYKLREIG